MSAKLAGQTTPKRDLLPAEPHPTTPKVDSMPMRPKENDGQAPGCPSQAGFGTGAGGIAAGGYFFIVSLAKKVDGTELLVLVS